MDAAKRLLADSGHAGEPISFMAPREVPALKAWGDVSVDLLKRLDMKVDFAAVGTGTLFVPWKISAIVDYAGPITDFAFSNGRKSCH